MRLSRQVRLTVLAGIVLSTTFVRAESTCEPMSEQEILAFLEALVPGSFTLLLDSKSSNPEGYKRLLSKLGHQITYYHQIRTKSPDLARSLLRIPQLALNTQLLAKQISTMELGSHREELMAELRRILEEKFDFELRRTEQEVEQLEKEIIRLRTIIEKQKLSRDDIVDRRLLSLIKKNYGTNLQRKTPNSYPPLDD